MAKFVALFASVDAFTFDLKWNPEKIAHLLVDTQKEWVELGEKGARNEIQTSCVDVVAGVLQGSGGDRDRVETYMTSVCESAAKEGDQAGRQCVQFRHRLLDFMTDDTYTNRANLSYGKFCSDMWDEDLSQTVKTHLEAKRQKALDVAAKQAEADKKKAAEDKEAAKVAEEEAKKPSKAVRFLHAMVRAEQKATITAKTVARRLFAKAEAMHNLAYGATLADRLAEEDVKPEEKKAVAPKAKEAVKEQAPVKEAAKPVEKVNLVHQMTLADKLKEEDSAPVPKKKPTKTAAKKKVAKKGVAAAVKSAKKVAMHLRHEMHLK